MDERTVNDVAANAMSRPSVYVPALVDEITRLRAELEACRNEVSACRMSLFCALDILWKMHGNGFGTDYEEVIAILQEALAAKGE